MRRFTKYSLIVGCGLILIGVMITAAASAMGARPYAIGDFFQDRFLQSRHEIHHEPRDYMIPETTIAAEYIDEFQNNAPNNIVAETITPNIEEEFTGPANETASFLEATYPAVEHLDIQIRNGYVEIVPDAELSELMITNENGSLQNIHYDSERHTLYLSAEKDEFYLIQIPADWELRGLDVKNANGTFICNGLSITDADLQAANAEITLSQISGTKLEIDCANSTIDWTCQETMPQKIEVENANGSVILNLPGSYDANTLGYDVECHNGTVEFPFMTLERNQEITRRGDAGQPHLDLETSNGSIVVNTQ